MATDPVAVGPVTLVKLVGLTDRAKLPVTRATSTNDAGGIGPYSAASGAGPTSPFVDSPDAAIAVPGAVSPAALDIPSIDGRIDLEPGASYPAAITKDDPEP